MSVEREIQKRLLALHARIEKAGKGGWKQQPRHPAGTKTGGQFASTKGTSGGGGMPGGETGAAKGQKPSAPGYARVLAQYVGGQPQKPKREPWQKLAQDPSMVKVTTGGHPKWQQKTWNGPLEPNKPKPGSVLHPHVDDKGNPVTIKYPTKASGPETWHNPGAVAVFTPGGNTPDQINNIPLASWKPPAEGFASIPTNPAFEQPVKAVPGKSIGAGVIILEDDGRIWLTKPTNEFGGYRNTYPKGTQESGLNLQQTAIKEVWEETGLHVEITGIAGDYERTTSVARMFVARRVGGTPKDMGWESQGVRLAPMGQALKLLNQPHDRNILEDFIDENFGGSEPFAKAAGAGAKAGAWASQPRWPKGTALGGQWKTVGADGLTLPPTIAGGLDSTNPAHQKKAVAAHAAAQAGNIGVAINLVAMLQEKADAWAAGGANSQTKYAAQVHQYAVQLVADAATVKAVSAKAEKLAGPVKVENLKYLAAKKGGSNPGGVYEIGGEAWLVKGNKQLELGNVDKATSENRAKNEVLAAKLLAAAGVGSVEMRLADLGDKYGGGLGVAGKLVEKEDFDPKNTAHVAAAQADFAVHAWLGNYDVLGMGYDNTVFVGGVATNIDPGGALLFRAQGLPKKKGNGGLNLMDPTAGEWETMRHTSTEQATVFGSMTAGQLADSAERLKGIDDDTIRALVKEHGPGDEKFREKFAQNLVDRKNAILEKVKPQEVAPVVVPSAGAMTVGEHADLETMHLKNLSPMLGMQAGSSVATVLANAEAGNNVGPSGAMAYAQVAQILAALPGGKLQGVEDAAAYVVGAFAKLGLTGPVYAQGVSAKASSVLKAAYASALNATTVDGALGAIKAAALVGSGSTTTTNAAIVIKQGLQTGTKLLMASTAAGAGVRSTPAPAAGPTPQVPADPEALGLGAFALTALKGALKMAEAPAPGTENVAAANAVGNLTFNLWYKQNDSTEAQRAGAYFMLAHALAKNSALPLSPVDPASKNPAIATGKKYASVRVLLNEGHATNDPAKLAALAAKATALQANSDQKVSEAAYMAANMLATKAAVAIREAGGAVPQKLDAAAHAAKAAAAAAGTIASIGKAKGAAGTATAVQNYVAGMVGSVANGATPTVANEGAQMALVAAALAESRKMPGGMLVSANAPGPLKALSEEIGKAETVAAAITAGVDALSMSASTDVLEARKVAYNAIVKAANIILAAAAPAAAPPPGAPEPDAQTLAKYGKMFESVVHGGVKGELKAALSQAAAAIKAGHSASETVAGAIQAVLSPKMAGFAEADDQLADQAMSMAALALAGLGKHGAPPAVPPTLPADPKIGIAAKNMVEQIGKTDDLNELATYATSAISLSGLPALGGLYKGVAVYAMQKAAGAFSATSATAEAKKREAVAAEAAVLASNVKPAPMPPKPAFLAPFKGSSALAYYTKLAGTAEQLAAAGDLAGLKALATSGKYEGGAPWKPGSHNGNLAAEYHAALVAHLEQAQAVNVLAGAKVADEQVSAPPPKTPAGPAAGPLPAMPDVLGAKLPPSNSNAKSHNAKVEVIHSLATAGDVKGLLALAYSTNTQGKKQAKLVNSILAALGSPYTVAAGQAANANPALHGGHTADQVAAAAATLGQAAPQPSPAPGKVKAAQAAAVGGSDWPPLAAGEKLVEKGETFGVKWAKVETPATGFDPKNLPKPPDFFNNGAAGPTGKWKSSVEHVNADNNAFGKLIHDTAVSGKGAAAVEALKWPAIDKATGKPTGKFWGIHDHPAAEVKEYATQITAELKAQLLPGFKTVHSGSFTNAYGNVATELAAKFKPIAYEKFSSAQKAADYVILSKDGAASVPPPEQGFAQWWPKDKSFTEYKKASDAGVEGLSASKRQAINQYTGNAYIPWNEALRTGDVKSSAYSAAQPMVKAFKEAATTLPTGTVLWRGIGVGGATYKSVVGGVIQDGSFNSSSYGNKPAFDHHHTWLKIHVPHDGVRAIQATSISKYGTGEREVIIQNNVRYAVLSVTEHKNFQTPTADGKLESHGSKTIVELIALPHED